MLLKFIKPGATALGFIIVLSAVSGCGLDVVHDYPVKDRSNNKEIIYESELAARKDDTLFGGFKLFSDDKKNSGSGGGPGITVNSFLWRASLDTISFMPLSSADPFGGVIITDWYSPPEAPQERYKLSVYILGRQLRADGIKVAVFRQRAAGPDAWLASPVAKDTAPRLENQILTRARQLRIGSEGG